MGRSNKPSQDTVHSVVVPGHGLSAVRGHWIIAQVDNLCFLARGLV